MSSSAPQLGRKKKGAPSVEELADAVDDILGASPAVTLAKVALEAWQDENYTAAIKALTALCPMVHPHLAAVAVKDMSEDKRHSVITFRLPDNQRVDPAPAKLPSGNE